MLPASPRHLHWESNLPCLIESSLPVILRRHVWKQSLQAPLMQRGLQMHHLFMRRYVDNRLVLCDSQVSSGDAMREFLHTGFYGSSIELEEVTDHSFLGLKSETTGFTICMSDRTVLYQQPTSPWQIRHYNSAGSMQMRAAGFHSGSSHLEVLVAPRSPEATGPSAATDVCRPRFHPDAASVVANTGVFCRCDNALLFVYRR